MADWQTMESAPKDKTILLYGGIIFSEVEGPIGQNEMSFAWRINIGGEDEAWRTYGRKLTIVNPENWRFIEPPE